MTSTNYLNPEDFQKLVNAIPLVTEYNKSKLLNGSRVPNSRKLQQILIVQYCCALRISEVLRLRKENFNFKTKILTLEKTKTGFKKKDGVKVRKKQFTSIPPDFPEEDKFMISHFVFDEPLYKLYTRQLIWSYVKKAAVFAKLELGEQQEAPDRWFRYGGLLVYAGKARRWCQTLLRRSGSRRIRYLHCDPDHTWLQLILQEPLYRTPQRIPENRQSRPRHLD